MAATQLWLAPLFGTVLGASARTMPEEASRRAVIIVTAAHAHGLFFLIMTLLTVPGSWSHSSNAAWQILIIYAVTLG